MNQPSNPTMAMPLIATRLMPPRLAAGALERQRLLQPLYAGAQRGGSLLVVTAPAGYGKSTLLAQCYRQLQQAGHKVSWLTLEEEDNEEAQFFYYLAATLGGLCESISPDQVDHYLDNGGAFQGRRFVSSLIQSLVSETQSLALFLDDYQLIQAPVIHDTLSYLLKYLPENLTLVVGSREPLPLPLAKLKAGNKLVALGEEDLRFDRKEARTLFCETNQLQLSEADLEVLYGRTEGWAAVMQLAALSAQGAEDLQAFLSSSLHASGGHPDSVSDFFAEEVVSHMSQPLADLLMRTSIVERLCAPLCGAITGDTQAGEKLKRLWDARFLLQGLDDQGYWYRLHPLLRNFWLRQLQEKEAADIANLHHRASDWFEKEGLAGEAIQHALSAGDNERALELLEEWGTRLTAHGHFPLMFSLFKRLPPALLQDSREILIQMAWLMVLNNQMTEARRLLTEVKGFEAELTPQRRAELYTIEIVMHFIADDYVAARQLLDVWLPQSPEEPSYILGSQRAVKAFLHFNSLEYAEALEEVQWVLAKETDVDLAYTRAYVACLSGLISFAGGCLQDAETTLRREIAHLQQVAGRQSRIVGLIEPILGVICYCRGDLTQALELFEHGFDAQRVNASPDMVVVVLRASVRLLHYLGRHDDALGYLQQAQQMADERGWRRLLAAVMHERVRLYLALGEPQMAQTTYQEWAQNKASSAKAHQTLVRQGDEWEILAEARLSQAAGDVAKAAVILKSLLTQFLAHNRRVRAMEVLVLLARGYMHTGQLPAAKQVLTEALALDQENGVIQLFREEGEAVMEALRALRSDLQQRTGEESHQLWQQQIDTITAVLDTGESTALKGRPLPDSVTSKRVVPAEPAGGALVESLTKRELATLALLVEGHSNKEISDQLCVSINTVKTHLQSAYAKLGVSRRTQAVRRLKELAVFDRP